MARACVNVSSTLSLGGVCSKGKLDFNLPMRNSMPHSMSDSSARTGEEGSHARKESPQPHGGACCGSPPPSLYFSSSLLTSNLSKSDFPPSLYRGTSLIRPPSRSATRVRAKKEQLKSSNNLFPSSQGQSRALTVLWVPHFLDSGPTPLNLDSCTEDFPERVPQPEVEVGNFDVVTPDLDGISVPTCCNSCFTTYFRSLATRR